MKTACVIAVTFAICVVPLGAVALAHPASILGTVLPGLYLVGLDLDEPDDLIFDEPGGLIFGDPEQVAPIQSSGSIGGISGPVVQVDPANNPNPVPYPPKSKAIIFGG